MEDGSVAHEFVPFSARQLHRVPVDITGLTQNAQIAQRMKEQARGLSPEDMVEFLLTGESDPTADISAPYLQQTLQGSFFVKVKDESHLALDADAYRNDVSLKGRVYPAGAGERIDGRGQSCRHPRRAAGAFRRGDFIMRLLRCHIENFGVLSGFDYEFPEGLAVICRENGFGKSTLAAFLKAMFYGLPRTGAHNVTENERRRFEPWQGGKFGGFLEFEYQGAAYRVTRYFGKTAAKDTFSLRDLTRRTDETPFSSRLGEELFGLDAASFARSTYLRRRRQRRICRRRRRCAQKLSNLVDDTNDMNNFDTAEQALRQFRRNLRAYSGDKGEIADCERELHVLEAQTLEARQKLPRLEEVLRGAESGERSGRADNGGNCGPARKNPHFVRPEGAQHAAFAEKGAGSGV